MRTRIRRSEYLEFELTSAKAGTKQPGATGCRLGGGGEGRNNRRS
jgi:hypothetical protein